MPEKSIHRRTHNGEKKATIYYNHDRSDILYQRGDLIIGTVLKSYDDIISVVDFDNGLLTAKMMRGTNEVEEYIDFDYALSLLYMSKMKEEYFRGITSKNLVVER